MKTQDDIAHKQPITIEVQVLKELDKPSPKMATRLLVADRAGNRFALAIWKNNALSDYDWTVGQWYRLENARGNVFNGKQSLNGSSNMRAIPLEASEEDGTSADDVGRVDTILGNMSPDQAYLSLFPISRSFNTLSVYEYSIEAAEAFEDAPDTVTYRCAGRLRRITGAGVAYAGPMRIVSTRTLPDKLADPFSLSEPTERELKAVDARDRHRIERLLKSLVKAAIDDSTYDPYQINRIRARTPSITAGDGLFEACYEFAARVDVMPSGDAFVGIEVRYHARSQVTADVYEDKTGELVGTIVEHDPERYNISGTGRVVGFTDHHFTDALDELGGLSLADWYAQKGRVPEGVLEALREKNPRLVDIQYQEDEPARIHVPELLRVAPRKEVVKELDPAFHRRWDREAKMLPDKRFRHAIEFVDHLGSLPDIDATVAPEPLGPSLSYMSTAVDREKNLRFKDGRTATTPSSGIRSGVYQQPTSFDIAYVYPTESEQASKRFISNFENKLSQCHCEPTETRHVPYELGGELSYLAVINELESVDAVLAVVPPRNDDRIAAGDITDPYPEFKKGLGKQKVPSQMVVTENLGTRWVMNNTAMGLIAGSGGVPWRVDEMPGEADCFIGLDVTRDPETGQHLGASANVVYADGTVFASKTQTLQSGETFDEQSIIDVIKDVFQEFVRREGRSPEHIVIHRDGRLFEDADEIQAPFADSGVSIDILDVRKSGAPRIARYEDNSFKIDEKGRLFISQDDTHGFIATTGKPEFDDSDNLGTPKTLRVVRRAGDTPMLTLLKQVYWLSEAHVGSVSRSVRLPITTYYADRCAEHAREGYLLHGELIEGVPYL